MLRSMPLSQYSISQQSMPFASRWRLMGVPKGSRGVDFSLACQRRCALLPLVSTSSSLLYCNSKIAKKSREPHFHGFLSSCSARLRVLRTMRIPSAALTPGVQLQQSLCSAHRAGLRYCEAPITWRGRGPILHYFPTKGGKGPSHLMRTDYIYLTDSISIILFKYNKNQKKFEEKSLSGPY